MLRSDLCDSSDVYIVVKELVSFTGANAVNRTNKKLTSKNHLHQAFQKLITHL